VRLAAHVGHALHVVLAAQRVHAAAGFAHVAGDHGQVGDQHHGVGALVVLGDAQAVEDMANGDFA
jgi:hypothetical protein